MYRVSNVEAFRQWEADDEADTDMLLKRIRGEDEPSALMTAGTAFHKALETAPTGIEVSSLEALGHVFTFSDDLHIELPQIRELRASKTYMVDGEPICISGQVDALEGLRIEDHKTTGRFDPERYLIGCQWMLYLDIFGAREFRWNVFEIQEVDSTAPTEGFDLPPPEYEVFAQHRLTQYAYPGMAEDVQALVTRFARFVRERIEVAV